MEADFASEWLLTDGRGGYAMGTRGGLNTRKYHGLLVAARPAPTGRVMLVSRVEDVLVASDGERFPLCVARYEPGVLHPDGHERMTGFAATPEPAWTYLAAGREVRRTVELERDGDGLTVRWDLLSGEPARLLVRPMLTRRSHHAVLRAADLDPIFDVADGVVTWRPRAGEPATVLCHNGRIEPGGPCFYENVRYDRERDRGYDAVEDFHAPCVIAFDLEPDAPAVLHVVAEDEPPPPPLLRVARPRDGGDAAHDALVRAGDAFLVRSEDGTPGVIAGYPWFEEWARDTMIAVPGLCLATGRPELAFRILDAWAARLADGILPNRLDDAGAHETNSVDAPLLMIRAIAMLDGAGWDRRRVARRFQPVVNAILDAYVAGTRHGIGIDADGLVRAGQEGCALTWMDAVTDGVPVTPRSGKPVEINALFLDALSFAADLCDRVGDDEHAALFRDQLAATSDAMRARFIDPSTGLIRDVLDPVGPGDGDALRPNLLFALASSHCPFTPEEAARNLDRVERDLLTPFGLRTLAPGHPDYAPRYEGDQRARDRAYHQGTVWPWLLGPYADAVLRIRGEGDDVRAALGASLAPLLAHAVEYGMLPEVCDGEPPHAAGGCPAQAWSVAEVLRVLTRVGATPGL